MGVPTHYLPSILLSILCLGHHAAARAIAAAASDKPTMEHQSGQSNSTTLIHGHGHHHLPDLDGTKTSDEVIILILGAIVFLTFALGFAFQLNDKPVWFLRRKHPVWDEDEDNDNDFVGQVHQMAELDLEAAATAATATVTDPLLFKSEVDGDGAGTNGQFPPTRWAARYGAITQHHVDVGGVRKMVLVVEGDVTSPGVDEAAAGPSIQDGYTEWFERWRGRHKTKPGRYTDTGGRALDEGDNLLDEDGVTLLDSAAGEAAIFGDSASLLVFDPDEDEDEEDEVWQSAPSQRNSM